MSQSGANSSSSGPVPPTVATTYTEDSGTATPAANNLNVNGSNGIKTSGTGSTVTISIQNGITSNTTTTNNETVTITSIPLSSSTQVYSFDIRVAAYRTSGGAGAGFNIWGTVRTNGTTASLVGTPDKVVNLDPLLSSANSNLSVSGNNAIITVTGVSAIPMQWGSFSVYVTAI